MMNGFEAFKDSGETTGLDISGTPFWGSDPGAWDEVFFAGRLVPGLAQVKGKVRNRVDRKTIAGTNGQTFTHIGYEPAEVEVTVRVWTEEQLSALPEILKLLRPTRSAPKPFDITHPACQIIGITSLLVIDISLLERDEAKDSYSFTITCREFVPSQGKGKGKNNVDTAKSSADLTNLDQAYAKQLEDAKKPSAQNAKSPFGATPDGIAITGAGS